mgnify:CR=1 FL=1
MVKGSDKKYYDAVMAHWDSLAKPIDGLGDLERIVAQIGSIRQTDTPCIDHRTLLLFLSDNGIVAENVSQSESSVTHNVAEAMSRRESTVCVMAEKAGVDLLPVDIGMIGDPVPGITYRRIREGTRDFAVEPAMTMDETKKAIDIGREMAALAIDGGVSKVGCDVLLLGEMGIGNTSTATAVSCALLGLSPFDMAGHGAGLSERLIEHKKKILSDALKKYDFNPEDAIEVLSIFGGYDIAGMTGAILEAAKRHVPVILDGLITLSAALVAARLATDIDIASFCIPSHFPREPMGQHLIHALGYEKAPIDAGIALGEGTGAVLLMPLLDVCMHLYYHGQCFERLSLQPYERYGEATAKSDT